MQISVASLLELLGTTPSDSSGVAYLGVKHRLPKVNGYSARLCCECRIAFLLEYAYGTTLRWSDEILF